MATNKNIAHRFGFTPELRDVLTKRIPEGFVGYVYAMANGNTWKSERPPVVYNAGTDLNPLITWLMPSSGSDPVIGYGTLNGKRNSWLQAEVMPLVGAGLPSVLHTVVWVNMSKEMGVVHIHPWAYFKEGWEVSARIGFY